MKTEFIIARLFMVTALVMLLLSLVFGTLAAHSYSAPGIWKDTLGFLQLRPLHVSSALFWILLGATAGLHFACASKEGMQLSSTLSYLQFGLWFLAIVGIYYAYFTKQFGGREYWEFPPIMSLPIMLSWLIFIINFLKSALKIKRWPVYYWMWMTGLLFFMFTFLESYLWIFPYFRIQFVKDMLIQWKSSGSMVGAWNQLIYGLAFYLMERISKDEKVAHSKIVFVMYFIGLSNLMFNWAHHVYTLPTAQYIRYIGYGVSMTEWILFIRIIYKWKQSLLEAQRFAHHQTYRFLLAADVWVFINLGLALLMSIPAINIYTHGTHITVAHAMGTTIGINTMILLGVCFEFVPHTWSQRSKRWVGIWFWLTQISLLLFWLTLLMMGIEKSIWQMKIIQPPFQEMMLASMYWFRILNYVGALLMIGLGSLALQLILNYAAPHLRKTVK